MKHDLRIGLFGIGLEAYWEQFTGLKERLAGYVDIVATRLHSSGAVVTNLGLIDTPEKAFEAGHRFCREDIDLLFLYVTTYAVSSTVLPVVKRVGVPVIILNLSPEASIDYDLFNAMDDRNAMTKEWLAYCSACPVPEIANVFKRARIPFYQVTGTLDNDPIVWNEIGDWITAASVVNTMYHNRLGVMGNYYGGMLDIYSDLTLQCATFGGHIEVIEADELSGIRQKVTQEEITQQLKEFEQYFDIQEDCSKPELERAACTSVALHKLADKHKIGSLAYYHKGSGTLSNENTMSSVILGNSLLTAKGIPVAGEYEIKNVQAMKIMDILGVGGSFTEYYAMDYNDDVVLMGHDGPGHLGIAEGKIKVRPLKIYHGKVGNGLSVEMSVKLGKVTLLSVAETTTGGLSFVVAEAESVAGPILEIGNTNSRYRFSIGARAFVERWNAQGPAHHCAIGTGHIANKIKKVGELLGVPTVQVC